MPPVKNLSGTTGARKERLFIMDEILCKSLSAISTEVFFRQINRKLKTKIKKVSLDVDLRYLRKDLEEYSKIHGVEVFLIQKRNIGYYYSINGFKLYNSNILFSCSCYFILIKYLLFINIYCLYLTIVGVNTNY